MRPYATALIELVYPPRCPSCLRLTLGGDFCPRCARLLPTIGPNICGYCGKPAATVVDDCRDCRGRPLNFDGARAAWIYESLARDVIHTYKFANQKSLAPALARYLAPLIETRPKTPDAAFLITWVPLTRRKTWRRGYNQAKLLALNLSDKT
ncbi:MAG: double zinc ribbon domain-containing protein, partial [Actinomycetota bacterium]|nr:double zinc ribbon domain-containing protein [Actinomycetota bacterium]